MKILDIVSSEKKYASRIDYYLENEVKFLTYPVTGTNLIFVHKDKINDAGKIIKSYIGDGFVYARTECGTGFVFYEDEVEDAED